MKRHIPIVLAAGLMIAATRPAGALNVGPIDHAATTAECAACHMAFPSELLPQRSWQALLGDLSHHFGEDASLAPEVQADILNYLVKNSADTSDNQKARRLLRGLADNLTPLRVTEMPWWKRSHSEVSAKRYTRPEIKSAANCVACHRGADKGEFYEE
jgi:Dihaem cytochrome c